MATQKHDEEMTRTSISLPDSLYKRLRHVVVEAHPKKTLNEVMVEAIEKFVEQKERKSR